MFIFFGGGGVQERKKSIIQSEKRLIQSTKNDTHGIILTSRLPPKSPKKANARSTEANIPYIAALRQHMPGSFGNPTEGFTGFFFLSSSEIQW